MKLFVCEASLGKGRDDLGLEFHEELLWLGADTKTIKFFLECHILKFSSHSVSPTYVRINFVYRFCLVSSYPLTSAIFKKLHWFRQK